MNRLLTEEQTKMLESYRDGILEINKSMNLTRVCDPEEFWDKHVLDSLACVGLDCYKDAKKVLDLGTGAGFPGIHISVFLHPGRCGGCGIRKEVLLMCGMLRRPLPR